MIQFPDFPINGQEFVGSNGVLYRWSSDPGLWTVESDSSFGLSVTTGGTRVITSGDAVQMLVSDYEIVVSKSAASPTTVTLPNTSSVGHQRRVSDGAGNASTGNILVQASLNGMINGATGALVMATNWETTLLRSLGGNDWSII